MDRRRFLKVAGIGMFGLAAAPFIKFPKTEDAPKPKEELINLTPPKPVQKYPLGSKLETPNGRRYVYCKAGEDIIVEEVE